MSNLLNNQVGQALTNVGNALQQLELTEFNTLRGAKLSLYHAHGITSKAEGELKEHQEQSKKSAQQSKIAAIGVNATANVSVAAKAAVLDASTTTSNAAAAAASVQKAATALTTLSGNIATTLAIANTLDKGTRIQSLVEKASKATVAAAELAEQASLIALNLTIEASQSRAASVVTQSDDVKSKMIALQKMLSDTFGKQQDLITEDEATVSSAVTDESQQAGIYKTARAEDQALSLSASFINQYINNGLTVTINEFNSVKNENLLGDTFSLSFLPFQDELENIDEYRIMIVRADDAVTFNIESAKSIQPKQYVSLKPEHDASDTKPEYKVYQQEYYLANVSSEMNGDTDQSLFSILHSTHKPVLAVDSTGQPVVRGIPYKFFVYVVYTSKYQNDNNDTNGLLSLPSESFSLGTPLPVVQGADMALAFYEKNEVNGMRLVFKVPSEVMLLPNGTDLNELMEMRAFIFNEKDKTACKLNKDIDNQAGKVYQSDDNFRLLEEKYQQAKGDYENAISKGESQENVTVTKSKMDAAKLSLHTAKTIYNTNVKDLEQLVENKISDFVFDLDIAQTIPQSNYSVATLIPNFLDELKKIEENSSAALSAIQETKTNLSNKSNEYNDLSVKIGEAELPLKEKIKETQQGIANDIASLKASLKMDIPIKSEEDAQEFKKNLSQYQTVDKSISIKIKTENETESFEFDEQEIDTKKSEKENELINSLIKEFKTLKKQQSELAGLAEVANWRKQLNEINTEIILLKAKLSMLEDELTGFIEEAKTMKPMKDKFANDVAGAYQYFEVSNTQGDFTDNFGESLVTGDNYCVAVLSIIKATEPDAAPLFKSTLSDFSAATPFLLTQI